MFLCARVCVCFYRYSVFTLLHFPIFFYMFLHFPTCVRIILCIIAVLSYTFAHVAMLTCMLLRILICSGDDLRALHTLLACSYALQCFATFLFVAFLSMKRILQWQRGSGGRQGHFPQVSCLEWYVFFIYWWTDCMIKMIVDICLIRWRIEDSRPRSKTPGWCFAYIRIRCAGGKCAIPSFKPRALGKVTFTKFDILIRFLVRVQGGISELPHVFLLPPA